VLQLLAEGQSNREIAVKLGVSVTTIDSHRKHIMDKLGLRGLADLTKYAIREGLTSPE
jgi:two-component system, LuxR family, secretion system response regulator SsrB